MQYVEVERRQANKQISIEINLKLLFLFKKFVIRQEAKLMPLSQKKRLDVAV